MTPTSATGIWTADFFSRRGFGSGFTLLEVLVTLALIGIITGFAVLSIPGGGDAQGLQETARRLAARITINQQEAVLLGEQRGLRIGATAYDFWLWDETTEWTPMGQVYPLTGNIGIALDVEGRRVDLGLRGDIPQVLFLSSGEATAFSATLFSASRLGEHRYTITVSGDSLGRVWQTP